MAEEKQIENKIKAYLKSKGIWYIKIWGSMFTRNGTPDLLCCFQGKFLAIEVKSSVGKMSELQKHEANNIQKAGGMFYCLRPQNFEQFKQDIERIINDK